jgi:nucleoside-diphosphate-sugar epimerase
MRVVVTGGTGMVGRALVALLSSRDHDVTVIHAREVEGLGPHDVAARVP